LGVLVLHVSKFLAPFKTFTAPLLPTKFGVFESPLVMFIMTTPY